MADTTITLSVVPSGAAWIDNPRAELAAVLRKLADQLDAGHYATFGDLPEALFDTNGNRCGSVAVTLGRQGVPLECWCWADLLAELPAVSDANGADLMLDTGTFRVWLSRLGTGDGEPFARTVHVEEYDDGTWWEIGYFDGDEPDPKPTGVLSEAYDLTLDAVREAQA